MRNSTALQLKSLSSFARVQVRLKHITRENESDKNKRILILDGSSDNIKNIGISTKERTKKAKNTEQIKNAKKRIKRYDKELKELRLTHNEDSSVLKRKIKTLKKNETLLASLLEERSQYSDHRSSRKVHHHEFIFSISNCQNKFKNKEYLNDFYKECQLFIKNHFNCDIELAVCHLDQYNPHIHIITQYNDIHQNQKKDLTKSFGERNQYSNMHQKYNQQIRDSKFASEHNLEIVKTKRGGKRAYVEHSEYKRMSQRAEKKSKEQINNLCETYFKKIIFTDNYIISSENLDDLRKRLHKVNKKNLLNEDIPRLEDIEKSTLKEELQEKNNEILQKSQEIIQLEKELNSVKVKLKKEEDTNNEIDQSLRDFIVKNKDLIENLSLNSKFTKNIKTILSSKGKTDLLAKYDFTSPKSKNQNKDINLLR